MILSQTGPCTEAASNSTTPLTIDNLQSYIQLHIGDAGKTGTQNVDSLMLPTTRAPSEGTGLVRRAAIYLRVTHVTLTSSCPLLA
jgi:hypothetical protein